MCGAEGREREREGGREKGREKEKKKEERKRRNKRDRNKTASSPLLSFFSGRDYDAVLLQCTSVMAYQYANHARQ